MLRLIFSGWFLFIITNAIAQKKITDFQSAPDQSPNNFKYVAQLNNKIIFSAFTPETGTELWVSDGSLANTRMLKDIYEGETSTPMYSFAVLGNNLYFLTNNEIWKTDGTTENTNRIFKSGIGEYIYKLCPLGEKILAIKRIYSPQTTHQFLWVNTNDELELWEDNVSNFDVIPNSLIYSKFTESSGEYTFYHYKTTKKEVYRNTKGAFLMQFSHGNDTYASIYSDFNYNLERVMIHFRTENDFDVMPWGNHQPEVPLYAIDEDKNLRLIRLNNYQNDTDTLYIYKAQNGKVILETQFSPKNLNPRLTFPSTNKYTSNVIFKNNKLVFFNGYISYSMRAFHFNRFDILKNTLEQKELKNYFIEQGNTDLLISNLTDSTYKVTSYDYSFIYHSESNTATDKTGIKNEKLLFNHKGSDFELSDNLYLLQDSVKTPLLKTRKIFKNNFAEIHRLSFKDRQYILLSDRLEMHYELWRIDSVSQKKILSGIGAGVQLFQVADMPDKIFFTITDYKQLELYEFNLLTDDFKALRSFPATSYITYNNRSIIYNDKESYTFIWKDKTSDIPKDKYWSGYLVLPDMVYLSESCDGENCIYKVSEKGKKLLYKRNFNYELWGYQNTVYMRNDKKIISIDDKERVTVLIDSVDFHYYLNNYLVGITQKSDLYIYRTIDLRLNKIISINTFKVGQYLNVYEYNNQVVIVTDTEIGFYADKEPVKIQLPQKDHFLVPEFYKNGFFISSYSNNPLDGYTTMYYDIDAKKWTEILKNSGGNNPYFRIDGNSDFVIISQFTNEGNKNYLWNYATKKLRQLPVEYFTKLKGNYIVTNENTNSYIWSLPDMTLVDKGFPVKEKETVSIMDFVNVTTSTQPETGNELLVVGNDFRIPMPEIVKGAEGMGLKDFFYINNTLYVFAFTYTHGWQVWEMGKFSPSWLLANENPEDMGLILYPNPVHDFLYLKTAQSLNYRLVNISGQELMQGKLMVGEALELKNIPTGIYIMQFFDGAKSFSKKLIKY